MLRGLIFDLDNTLVDSRLDFELMRAEMDLPRDQPILEAIERLPPERAAWCHTVLHRHELAGAERSALLPGVQDFLNHPQVAALPVAIATRNSRVVAEAMLAKFEIRHELLLSRDCGPVKPDPWPVQFACDYWQFSAREVVMIGDYRFDVESGRAAGCRTVLLTHEVDPATYPNEERADLVIRSLAEREVLLAWLESI